MWNINKCIFTKPKITTRIYDSNKTTGGQFSTVKHEQGLNFFYFAFRDPDSLVFLMRS